MSLQAEPKGLFCRRPQSAAFQQHSCPDDTHTHTHSHTHTHTHTHSHTHNTAAQMTLTHMHTHKQITAANKTCMQTSTLHPHTDLTPRDTLRRTVSLRRTHTHRSPTP